jgi:hypothetical protein
VRGHLLDGDGLPVPVGAVGELHLAGPLLADGYLGRPAETAAAFVPDPFADRPGQRMYRTGDLARWRGDGTLQFLGRRDDQVKIRGHRVEPGEVAAALRELDEVADAVVLARTARGRDGTDEPYLVGYVVPAGPVTAAASNAAAPATVTGRIAARLAGTLPSHLVPAAWVLLAELPVSPSGKLDRSALPEPAAGPASAATSVTASVTAAPDPPPPTRPLPGSDRANGHPEPQANGAASTDSPATALEHVLHELWRAELAGPIGLDTEFFSVGGHSLNAIRLLNRVRERFDVDYPVLRFFQAPTIRAMAKNLRADRGDRLRVRGTV